MTAIPYYGEDCPCIVAYHVGWPDEQFIHGTLHHPRARSRCENHPYGDHFCGTGSREAEFQILRYMTPIMSIYSGTEICRRTEAHGPCRGVWRLITLLSPEATPSGIDFWYLRLGWRVTARLSLWYSLYEWGFAMSPRALFSSVLAVVAALGVLACGASSPYFGADLIYARVMIDPRASRPPCAPIFCAMPTPLSAIMSTLMSTMPPLSSTSCIRLT